MTSVSRRRLLNQSAAATLAASAILCGARFAYGQAAATSHIYVDSLRTEHLGRAIYQGIYEPGSPPYAAIQWQT